MHALGQLIKGSRSSEIGNDRTFRRGDNKEALNVVASDQLQQTISRVGADHGSSSDRNQKRKCFQVRGSEVL